MSKQQKEHLSLEELWECIDNQSVAKQHELHLHACADCRELLKELKLIDKDLNQLNNLDPSPSFSQTVITRWKTKEVTFPWFVPTVISCFLFVFGWSIYLLSPIKVSINSTFVQVTGFIIVLCTYLMIHLRNARNGSPFIT